MCNDNSAISKDKLGYFTLLCLFLVFTFFVICICLSLVRLTNFKILIIWIYILYTYFTVWVCREKVYASKIIPPPDYVFATSQNDVALVRLKTKVTNKHSVHQISVILGICTGKIYCLYLFIFHISFSLSYIYWTDLISVILIYCILLRL